MYIELKDGSCFDIYEAKSTPTAIVLMPLGKQQEVNNAYKAFKKEGNLSLFLFKTSTGTAAQYEHHIFDSMSLEGEEGGYSVIMRTHPMSETEVLIEKMKAMEELQATIAAEMETVRNVQEAQNEVLDYILMPPEPEPEPEETDSMNEMDMVLDIIGEPESEEMVESSETVKPEQEEEVTTDGEVSGDENQTGEA